jgi:hypothetical protein
MPTIKELKNKIKEHKKIFCPTYSNLKKAELMSLVSKLDNMTASMPKLKTTNVPIRYAGTIQKVKPSMPKRRPPSNPRNAQEEKFAVFIDTVSGYLAHVSELEPEKLTKHTTIMEKLIGKYEKKYNVTYQGDLLENIEDMKDMLQMNTKSYKQIKNKVVKIQESFRK